MKFNNRFFQVQADEHGQTLIFFLVRKLSDKKAIHQLFLQSQVYVNGKKAQKEDCLSTFDLVQIFLTSKESEFFQIHKIKIIHSTDSFLIVEKPSGLNSVPDPSHKQNNLFYLLNSFFQISLHYDSDFFVVHRLDNLTSGLIIVARTKPFADFLIDQFKNKAIQKKYLALATGIFKNKHFIVDVPLLPTGKNKKALISLIGKPSKTEFKVLEQYKDFALLEIKPLSGRTHQIRSHLNFIKHPIVNDPIYNSKKGKHFFLHAEFISFFAESKFSKNEFLSQLPVYFKKRLLSTNKL